MSYNDYREEQGRRDREGREWYESQRGTNGGGRAPQAAGGYRNSMSEIGERSGAEQRYYRSRGGLDREENRDRYRSASDREEGWGRGGNGYDRYGESREPYSERESYSGRGGDYSGWGDRYEQGSRGFGGGQGRESEGYQGRDSESYQSHRGRGGYEGRGYEGYQGRGYEGSQGRGYGSSGGYESYQGSRGMGGGEYQSRGYGYEPSSRGYEGYRGGQGYENYGTSTSQRNQEYRPDFGTGGLSWRDAGDGFGYRGEEMATTRQRWQTPQYAGKGPKGYQRSDERIMEDVNEELTRHPSIDASDITVQVNHGEVTLTGTVESREAKRVAEDVAERCSGVKEVQNQLRVGRSESSSQQSSSQQHQQSSQPMAGVANRGSTSEMSEANRAGKGKTTAGIGN